MNVEQDVENEKIEDIDQELEQEAREMGWVSEEEFKGKKEKWIPAADYVERGRHVIPIMRSANDRLRKDMLTTGQKLGTLQQQVEQQNSVIDKLTKQLAQRAKTELANQKKSITEDIKQAREDHDTTLEFQLVEQLEDIREQEKEIEEQLKAPVKQTPSAEDKNGNKGYSPEMNEWLKDNPWYGTDKAKTKAYTRLAEDLREEGEKATGIEFFNILDKEYEERFGEEPIPRKSSKQTPHSKVESGNSRGSGPAGNRGEPAKSWNSLPKEAKEACMQFADTLVGKNKRYETLDAWKTQYAKDYFESE